MGKEASGVGVGDSSTMLKKKYLWGGLTMHDIASSERGEGGGGGSVSTVKIIATGP